MSKATFNTPFDQLFGGERTIIEIGCGPNKRENAIGIDIVDLPGVDVVANIDDGLAFIPDSSVDEIYANHLLEHLQNLEVAMSEIERILKPKGRCYIVVPHFSNPHYYSDYTHRTPWGLYSIGYFCKSGWPYARHVPNFYNKVNLSFVSQRIVFYSRFRIIRWPKKAIQLLANSCPLAQELYEELLPWIIPADSLEIVFARGFSIR